MDIFNLLTMIGGLSLFLFGMNIMGQALERRAGGKLRQLLGRLTTGKIDGLDEVIRQQKAIGRNLNQLTMLCNMGRIEIASLAEMTQQYADTNRYLAELLERKRWSDGNG